MKDTKAAGNRESNAANLPYLLYNGCSNVERRLIKSCLPPEVVAAGYEVEKNPFLMTGENSAKWVLEKEVDEDWTVTLLPNMELGRESIVFDYLLYCDGGLAFQKECLSLPECLMMDKKVEEARREKQEKIEKWCSSLGIDENPNTIIYDGGMQIFFDVLFNGKSGFVCVNLFETDNAVRGRSEEQDLARVLCCIHLDSDDTSQPQCFPDVDTMLDWLVQNVSIPSVVSY